MKDIQDREYLERIPFVTELLRRIDDISQAIRHGSTGVDESLNLITDLPDSWRDEIKEDLLTIQTTYARNKELINKRYIRGTPESYKRTLDKEMLEASKDYSRNIKQRVINMLDAKGLLFLSRKEVPESEFVDMHEDNNDT